MAGIKDLLKKLKETANNIGSSVNSSMNDNQGWIRQGNFTFQPVKNTFNTLKNNNLIGINTYGASDVKNIQSAKDFTAGLKSSPVFQFGQTLGNTAASPYVNKTLQQNTQQYSQYINTALKMANQSKTQEERQRWLNLANQNQQLSQQGATNVQQDYNKTGLQIAGEGLGTAATLVGGQKLNAKTALTMAGISGGINKVQGGSFAQGAGTGLAYAPVFAGVSQATNPLLSKVVNFTPVQGVAANRITAGVSNVGQGIVSDISTGQKTTPLSMGIDLVTGLIGGKTQFDTGVKVKGMGDGKLYQSDIDQTKKVLSALSEEKKTGVPNLELRTQASKLANDYNEGFNIMPKKDWQKLSLEEQYKLISSKLTDLSASGEQIQMGIVGKQPSISTPQGEGIDLAEIKKLFERIKQYLLPSQISPESKGIKIKQEPTIKIKTESTQPTIKIKQSVPLEQPTEPTLKLRGFQQSVSEAPNVSNKVKQGLNLQGYEQKPNEQLMGEAKALLTEGGTIKDVKNIPDIDRKVTAAMQEALNLDAAGKHDEAAALFNNLSDIGTELGRGVQAYSLLQKMSPQAISLSAAGQIKKYNRTAKVKLPELTGEQQKLISGQVEAIRNMVDGKEKNIALNQLEQTINSFIPSSKTDKFITVWKAGLLTSLRTHIRNIAGNTVMQGAEITSQAPAGFADYLMSLRTGQRTISPTLKGTVSGAKEGFGQSVDIMKYGFDPSKEISKFDVKKITWKNTPTDQALKKYTDFVFNTLSAEDKPFWQSSYSRSLYNQAGAEAMNQGKKGNTKVIQNLVNNASEAMKNQATIDANYATFKDKNMISNVAANFKRVMGSKWYGKLASEVVAPFTGVPSSMLTKTFDYSPLGLLNGIKDAGKVVTKNVPDLQRQAAQEIGRGTIGTGIFALGAYLAGKGLITGQPKDDAERKQWELEGKQANSILINSKWRSINSIGPQAIILLAGAKADEELNNPEGNIGKYGLSLVQDQLNQTFLAGVQQPLQAITDPTRYGKSYVGGQISSLTPNIVKDISKSLDPTQREVDTGTMGGNIKTSIQAGVPIWRNQMTPKRDTLGNILKQEPTGLGAFVDLFNSKTPISNNVVDELKRLNEGGYNATPSKITKNQTINGTKVVLDQKSLDQYEEEAGKAVSTSLEALFNSNSYQKLDDESKQEAIDKLVTAERKKVRANIDLKYMPDTGYVKSTDAPTSLGGKISVYGKSIVTDPGQTIKAVIAGNPIRKVEGGTVILERKNSLGTLDKGNTSTQIDHKIALTLGGSNDESNLQVLTNEENQIKGQFETYLYKEMKAGRITKEEAQKKDLNWREEVNKLPKAEQTKIANSLKDEAIDETSENVYKLVSEAGTVTTIDLGKEIEEPKLTGFTEVDKKLKSSYKSAITTRINNVVKLYEDGQLTAEEAEKYIKALKAKSSSTGSGKKLTIGKTPNLTIKKIASLKIKPVKIPKLAFKITSTKGKSLSKFKTTKSNKLTSLKLKKIKTPKLNLTLKAPIKSSALKVAMA